MDICDNGVKIQHSYIKGLTYLQMDDTSKKYKLKKDRFTKVRGGTSKFIVVRCAECRYGVLLYQKDGPGGLLRLYLDKIHAPLELAELTKSVKIKSDIGDLHCSECGRLLALPMVYVPEKRFALRIIRGAVQTEKSDGIFPVFEKDKDWFHRG